MHKQAGLGDFLKTPIPGTRDWLVNTSKGGMHEVAKKISKAPSFHPTSRPSGVYQSVRKAPGTHTAGGVTSISEEELKHLGFGDLGKTGSVVYAAFQDELSKIAMSGGTFNETLANMARQTMRAPAAKGAAGAAQRLTAPAAQSSTRLIAAKPRPGLRSTILPPSGGATAAPAPYIPLHSNSPVHHSELANTVRPQPIGMAATMRPPMVYSA